MVDGHPALGLYSSNEPGELSQSPHHDDSTIDIVTIHFARGVAEAKCIVVTAVCVSVYLSV